MSGGGGVDTDYRNAIQGSHSPLSYPPSFRRLNRRIDPCFPRVKTRAYQFSKVLIFSSVYFFLFLYFRRCSYSQEEHRLRGLRSFRLEAAEFYSSFIVNTLGKSVHRFSLSELITCAALFTSSSSSLT